MAITELCRCCRFPQFDKIYNLNGVPVITVQLRYNGWVTEMKDPEKVSQKFCTAFRDLGQACCTEE
jgi:uncharacterized protein with NAD-binding domain and iron-sulfur cluster